MKFLDKLQPTNPKQKAKFDYYLFWVVFLSFLGLGIYDLYLLFVTGKLSNLFWALIMFVIAYFNISTLRAMRDTNIAMRQIIIPKEKIIETEKEMLDEFNK